ncbi:MAG: YolD-like family protein [Lachnospiraceae bacterium]|nr:YolD-like family protein [Lachnospiraceae bacterium]
MDQGRQKRDVHRYDDMLTLPHPVSKKHPSMARMNRAAQFAPFAALTGYEDAVRESARLTDQRQELEEDSRELLDEELQKICVSIQKHPSVTVTYFVPDQKKEGGSYVTYTGKLKRIDRYMQQLVFEDGTRIAVGDIYKLTACEA